MLIIGITSLMISALTEYLLHKIYLHKDSGHDHIRFHHTIFNGKETFSNPQSNPKDILSAMSYNIVTAIPTILYSLLIYINSSFSYSLLAIIVGALYIFWVEYSHYLYHKPSGKFIEKNKIFLHLKEHHRIHHIYYSYNYGIGSNMWDIILKSQYKKNKTPQ
ncbi:MAG: sterol desaturase family protein [Firmicutes bacterium]|nr:sterol desaturase family protein [Bacillota bacterium]